MGHQQKLLKLILQRMIDKDRAILVESAGRHKRPDERVLVKHPDFPIDEQMYEMAAVRAPLPGWDDTDNDDKSLDDHNKESSCDLAQRSLAAFGGVADLFGGQACNVCT